MAGRASSDEKQKPRSSRRSTVALNLWKPVAYLIMLVLSPAVMLVDCFRKGKKVNSEWIFAFALFLTLTLLFTGVCVLISEMHNNRAFALMGNFVDTRERLGENVRYSVEISYYALRYNVDPALIYALIDRESAGNPLAVSSKGARGLMQLAPATWRSLNSKSQCSGSHSPPPCSESDCIFVAESNIEAGTRYLSSLIRDYDGQIGFALEAYNAGKSTVDVTRSEHPYPETRSYTRSIASKLKNLRQDRVSTSIRLALVARKAIKWMGLASVGLWGILFAWILRKL